MTSPGDIGRHIRLVGNTRFHRTFVWARLCVRRDARLIGLDKIREHIAHEAALRATGFYRPLSLPRSCGRVNEEIQRIAEEVLDRAASYAREQRA